MHDRFGAESGEFVVQGLGVIIRCNGETVLRQQRTGIESRVHLHDGDAGFAVAGEQRALDRRRTAPARQQRSVDVERASRSRGERARRQ